MHADPVAQHLSDAIRIDPQRNADMALAVQRRFGGTSNLWGAGCVPLDPVDFEKRPMVGDLGWPISYPACGAPSELVRLPPRKARHHRPPQHRNVRYRHLPHRARCALSARRRKRGEAGQGRNRWKAALFDRIASQAPRFVSDASFAFCTALLHSAKGSRSAEGRKGSTCGKAVRQLSNRLAKNSLHSASMNSNGFAGTNWLDASPARIRAMSTPRSSLTKPPKFRSSMTSENDFSTPIVGPRRNGEYARRGHI